MHIGAHKATRVSVALIILAAFFLVSHQPIIGASGATVSFKFDKTASTLTVGIDSPNKVGAAQVKIDIPAAVKIGSASSGGFLSGATQLSSGTEHRWFQLSAEGSSSGILSINVEVPATGRYQISLLDVNLKDTQGNYIALTTSLPMKLVFDLAAKPVLVYPDRETQSVQRGGEFTIEVWVDPGQTAVASGELRGSFDPAALELLSIQPGSVFGSSPLQGTKQLEKGTFVYALARAGPSLSPTLKGSFALLQFKTLATAKAGTYAIVWKTGLADETGADITNIETKSASVKILACKADIDGDGIVDYKDLARLGGAYGKSKSDATFDAAADLNIDGTIDYKDLAILGADYGCK